MAERLKAAGISLPIDIPAGAPALPAPSPAGALSADQPAPAAAPANWDARDLRSGGPASQTTPVAAPAPIPASAVLTQQTPRAGALPPMPPEIAAASRAEQSKWRLQQTRPTIGSSVANVIPPEHADLHGEEYLKTLPIALQNNVKAVAEGLQPLSIASMRTGNREALAAMVSQYSPGAFGGRYASKAAVQKDFTSGPTAKNVTSANTVIAHIGTLDEMLDALKNNDLRLVNSVVNRLRTETGDPNVNNFDTAKQAVGNELMRVFRQVNASEAETKAWEERFKSSLGPDVLKGAIKTGVALLKGRIDAIDDQWKRGMETDKGFPNLISPRSKAVLDKLGLSVSDASANDKTVARSITNSKGWILKRDANGNQAYVSPDGKQFEELK